MRAFRLLLLLAAPLVFSACSLTETEPDDVRRGFIERVVISQIPLTNPNDGGAGWDGGGPDQADVYFLLLGVNDSDIIINGEEDGVTADDNTPNDGIYGNVAAADLPLVYRLDITPVAEREITVLDRSLRLQVKDDDSGELNPDDVMVTSQSFRLFDQIPATLPDDRRVAFTVTSADGTLTAQITVRYER